MSKRSDHIKSWKEIEYFDESWKQRIRQMATYIPPAAKSVMDIGCGKMWLKEYLPPGCLYYGIDYIDRGAGSYVFDLNAHEYPSFDAEIAFVSGCLEYIDDYKWLIEKLSSHHQQCIISYCTTDIFGDRKERRSLYWRNDLSDKELVALFAENNMQPAIKDRTATGNSIYVFKNE